MVIAAASNHGNKLYLFSCKDNWNIIQKSTKQVFNKTVSVYNSRLLNKKK